MAGEAHPVPSRTRKLSPLAPMVLRCSPWESRTPPASKGRFPLHVLRPAPGRPGAGLFSAPRAPGPRRGRCALRSRIPTEPGRSARFLSICAISAPLLFDRPSPHLPLGRCAAVDRPKRRIGTVPSRRFAQGRSGCRGGVDGHADAAHLKLHGLLARIFRLVRSGVLEGGCFLHGWA